MPIYEFKCSSCQNISEFLLKISENYPTECPNCHKNGGLEKILSSTNFHLKGGGWFNDAYNSKSNNKPNSKESSSSSNGKASSTDKKGTSSESPKADSPKKKETKPTSSQVSKD